MGRVLARSNHAVQIYPGKVDWPRVLGFGLALAVAAAALVGRVA